MQTTTVQIRGQHVPVDEGSNYKIILPFFREEVITYQQFLALMQAYDQIEDGLFINKRFVRKQDIKIIEPTKDLTAEQKRIQEDNSELLRKMFKDQGIYNPDI